MSLRCFGSAVQNCGRTFHMFHEEDKAKLLPKYIARTARIILQLNRQHLLFGEYSAELNIPVSPELALEGVIGLG